MDLLGIHPRHLFFQTIAFGKDQVFTQQNAGCRTNRVKGLADIQSQRGIGFWPNHRTVGIRCGFQETQTDRNREDCRKEHGVGCHVRCREKERTANNVQRQAN